MTEIDLANIAHRLEQKGSGLMVAYGADAITHREATRLACNFCFDLAREIRAALGAGAGAQSASLPRAAAAETSRSPIPEHPRAAASERSRAVVNLEMVVRDLAGRVAELEAWKANVLDPKERVPPQQQVSCAACRGTGRPVYGLNAPEMVCDGCKGMGVHRV